MTNMLNINKLTDAKCFPHPVGEIELLETHISWVILTGEYAYKIKKPVDLGFLNFSTLEARKTYCQKELELNRRLAPELYLDVVSIGKSDSGLKFDTNLPPIEYAVKMRQFEQSQQLDRLLTSNAVSAEQIDALADKIADFHQNIEQSNTDDDYGTPAAVTAPVVENFVQIKHYITDNELLAPLTNLEAWSLSQSEALTSTFKQRKAEGHIRNCHGDLHLGNIALVGGEITLFDCLEFSEPLRWIDTISDLAFIVMDLIDRGRSNFAYRLLDRYLQQTGDYEGLSVLRFYLVYRSLVRAKVTAIRASQTGISDAQKKQALEQYSHYVELAQSFTEIKQNGLFIAHGLSGSGKTSLTQPLLEHFGMIRLRSDVERQRLFKSTAPKDHDHSINQGIYTANLSAETYDHLLRLSHDLISAHYSVIVDATFLKKAQRKLFYDLAHQTDIPIVILHFHAEQKLLEKWINEREKAGKDASEATVDVLHAQIKSEEPIADNECDYLVAIDTGHDDAKETLITAVQTLPFMEH